MTKKPYESTAMAVRQKSFEAPIISLVVDIEKHIVRSLKSVPQFYAYSPNSVGKGKMLWVSKLGKIWKDAPAPYCDLFIEITDVRTTAMGVFQRNPSFDPMARAGTREASPGVVRIYTSPGVYAPGKEDYLKDLRGLNRVLSHEIRHCVDFCYDTDEFRTAPKPQDPKRDYRGYYNVEHELDARLTALFVRINSSFRGSALLALKSKIDDLSRKHRELLMDVNAFVPWVRKYDADKGLDSLNPNVMNPEKDNEANGKIRVFHEYLVDEYGMALKAIPKSEVTPARSEKWKALKASIVDTKDDLDAIKKIVTAHGECWSRVQIQAVAGLRPSHGSLEIHGLVKTFATRGA